MNVDTWLCHKSIGDASIYILDKLVKRDLIRGLPKQSLKSIKLVLHVLGVSKAKPCLSLNTVFIARLLELLLWICTALLDPRLKGRT